jgi:hypothetical protein
MLERVERLDESALVTLRRGVERDAAVAEERRLPMRFSGYAPNLGA